MVGSDGLNFTHSVVAGIAGLYVMFDVAYYLRGIYTAVAWTIQYRVAKSYSSKSHVFRTNLLSPSITWGICWFTDLDLMFHMNNSRYLRECDFARYKYLISCGLGAALRKTGYTMVLGASTIRYRRSIGLFDRFKIATRVLTWDDKSLYIEHKFHRFSDDFVCAIVLVKQSLVSGTVNALFKAALNIDSDEILAPPPFPEELSKWIESNNISSQKLNPDRQPNVPALNQRPLPLENSEREKVGVKQNECSSNSSPKARLRYVSEDMRDSM